MRRIVVLSFFVLLTCAAVQGDVLSYCGKVDPSFAWEVAAEKELENGTILIDLQVTSQTWMDIEWKHIVRIVVPPNVESPSLCGLYITGGDPSEEEATYFSMVAKITGCPMAAIYNIPNQPLYDGLHEDALISYTFMKLMETQDADWPLLYPMTKAVVRAMDAIQAYAEGHDHQVDGFLTFGASKRGWTTWFTAAVDPRVKGLAPIVYDNLNLEKQMPHQLVAFGSYSEEINDYSEKGLPDLLNSDEGKMVSKLVDPFTLRNRVTQPKLIIIGTNDPYWPLDALNLYYDDLYGPSYILYCPNQGHGINDLGRVLGGIAGMTMMLEGDLPMPELTWDCEEIDTKVKLSLSGTPAPPMARAWFSSAPLRDFREVIWHSVDLTADGEGVFSHELEKPKKGYAALYGEYVFKAGERNFMLCTNVYMVGPHPDKGTMTIISAP